MKTASLRAVPAVEKVLVALGETGLPRRTVAAVVRRELAALRATRVIPPFDRVIACVREALEKLSASRIRPLINGTGILVHTNFGRAPLGRSVIAAISDVGAQYNNLEYGLAEGVRGGRAAYLEHNLALLCGAEAATVVNNNAAALVLILQHFCKKPLPYRSGRGLAPKAALVQKNEVIISRGELIQIGGGFRIPDILESSGARLREVGTTNKTALVDYERALSPQTALILKVHRSNFYMDGFVESPSTKAISALARKKRVPLVEDLGSGAVIETRSAPGLEHEPTPAEVLSHGVDLVCFSGDKLLGGPQCGILAGKPKLIAALKREPLFRALRCDKLILAGLEAVVDTYLSAPAIASSKVSGRAVDPGSASPEMDSCIPVVAMLQMSNESLMHRAESIAAALGGSCLQIAVGRGRAQIGGGTLPRSVLPSVTLDITHRVLKPQELAIRFRRQPIPVIGYVARERFKLDLRTIFPAQDQQVIGALRAVAESAGT